MSSSAQKGRGAVGLGEPGGLGVLVVIEVVMDPDGRERRRSCGP